MRLPHFIYVFLTLLRLIDALSSSRCSSIAVGILVVAFGMIDPEPRAANLVPPALSEGPPWS